MAEGLALVLTGFFRGIYNFDPPYYIPLDPAVNNLIALALFTVILPIAILSHVNQRHVNSVEENIPSFLINVAQSTESGLTLPRALREACKEDYGPVSSEIRNALLRLEFGSDFGAALQEAGRRLHHPRAMEFVTILIEAYNSGGNLKQIFSTSIDLYTSSKDHTEESQTELRPYVVLVYVGVPIFFVAAFIILQQFLEPTIQAMETVQNSPGLGTPVSLDYLKSAFFWAAVFEAMFGGMVAGKIAHGSAILGLKHSAILLFLGIFFFNFLIF